MRNTLLILALFSLMGCKKNIATTACDPIKNEDGTVIDQTKCGDICVNRDHDLDNCGSCGNSCIKQGKISCIKGECSDACQSEYQTKCGTVCVDLPIDPEHCGSCDTKCTSKEMCMDGKCVTPPAQ
jgi:hypothetical protein